MTSAGEPLHLAARVEDAVQSLRQRWGMRRGLVPTIVPFTGYGGTGWIRVLGRVVLRRPPEPGAPEDEFRGIRGWRSFTSVHVPDIEVTIRAGRTTRTIRSDRGGVLDAHIDVKLAALGKHATQFSAAKVDAMRDRARAAGVSCGVGYAEVFTPLRVYL